MPVFPRFRRLRRTGKFDQELWWKNYSAFLKSPQWTIVRRFVLRRDCYRCRYCGGWATVCHHLRYIAGSRIRQYWFLFAGIATSGFIVAGLYPDARRKCAPAPAQIIEKGLATSIQIVALMDELFAIDARPAKKA